MIFPFVSTALTRAYLLLPLGLGGGDDELISAAILKHFWNIIVLWYEIYLVSKGKVWVEASTHPDSLDMHLLMLLGPKMNPRRKVSGRLIYPLDRRNRHLLARARTCRLGKGVAALIKRSQSLSKRDITYDHIICLCRPTRRVPHTVKDFEFSQCFFQERPSSAFQPSTEIPVLISPR